MNKGDVTVANTEVKKLIRENGKREGSLGKGREVNNNKKRGR